jgi:hypothetical protein
MNIIAGIVVSLLKGYLVKLATKEFIEFVILEVADAAVKSTKTEADDKWLAKVKDVVKS